MAILDKLEVTISVGDEVLKEYDCEIDLDRVTSSNSLIGSKIRKYIEAQGGSRFSVNFVAHQDYILDPGATHLSWDIYFDGRYIDGNITSKNNIGTKRFEQTVFMSEAKVERKLHRKYFRFDELDISQEDVTISEAEKFKEFGTIEVKVWPWRQYSPVGPRNELYGNLPIVPQKGVKFRAVTLGVGYELEISEDCNSIATAAVGVELGSQPVAHFIFEYRTKESLEKLDVIKQPSNSVSATPLDQRDPTTLNPQELLQLVELLKTKIKTEPESTLKRERSLTPINGNNKKRVKTSMRIEDAISID